MRLRKSMMLAGLVVVTVGAAYGAWAAQEQKRPAQAAPADDPRVLEATARQRALGLPGPEHRALEPLVGRYKVDFTTYTPGAEPTHLTGTCENRLTFGGRFLLSELAVGEGDARFESLTTYGYDNGRKQYFSYGINSRRTGPTDHWGTYDATTRSFILNGKVRDDNTGTVLIYRALLKVESADSHMLQVFFDVPRARPRKALEVTFTRQ
jgi:Protein of unknown function (DUF1579)